MKNVRNNGKKWQHQGKEMWYEMEKTRMREKDEKGVWSRDINKVKNWERRLKRNDESL